MADFIPGAPAVPLISWPKSADDAVVVGPGTTTIGSLDTDTLYHRLVALGVAVDPSMGRAAIIAAFIAARLARFNSTGQAAIDTWLGGG